MFVIQRDFDFLIHSADHQSRPVVITDFTHVISVLTFKFSKTKQMTRGNSDCN